VLDDVPEAHLAAAEEVRAHLVALRGGAPFLSSADAVALVGWLDDGVPVSAILRALERAADARRKRAIRGPLRLVDARRHLGRPTAAPPLPPASAGGAPFAPIAAALRGLAEPGAASLADALASLAGEDADRLVRDALALARVFHEARWARLAEPDRQARLDEASRSLGDVAALLDEAAVLAAAEEIARDTLRRELPMLTAATFWHLAER
jgi:hypothetical protein